MTGVVANLAKNNNRSVIFVVEINNYLVIIIYVINTFYVILCT